MTVFENRVHTTKFLLTTDEEGDVGENVAKSFITFLRQIFFGIIKSRKMRYTGHLNSISQIKNAVRIFLENLNLRDNSEDLEKDGAVILKYI
jgi:hypothetical protein